MAKPTKIKTLAVIREIPFNQLVLSQANVRHGKDRRVAAVSPRLLESYVAEEMTLEHVMAFTLTTDHARQEQIWEAVKNLGYHPSPIRSAAC